ncbi:acyltransferase family protein [Paraburkholderia sp. D1E]|uniref:acyltransferase family protein n=1 Tax=Paraburkholderia sp. D1E TaxID=3461398 RepID=UPI0040453D5D
MTKQFCFDGGTMRKIDTLTGLRAFAALLVVIYHYSDNAGVVGLGLTHITKHWVWGVDIFFVLSGYILSYTYIPTYRENSFNLGSYGAFITKRIARIYPLHLATFLIVVVMWLTAVRSGHEFAHSQVIYTMRSAVENLLMVHAWGLESQISWNFVSWSISAEWFAYLFLFPLCVLVLQRFKQRVTGVLVVLCWLALCTYSYGYRDVGVGFTTDGFIRIVPEFLAGYWLFRWRHMPRLGDLDIIYALAALAYFSVADWPSWMLLLPVVMVLISGVAYGRRMSRAIFGNCVTVFLGEISFSIYLIHPVVQIVCNQMVRSSRIQNIGDYAGAILLAEIGLVVAAGAICHFVIELPCRHFIVGLLKQKKAKDVATGASLTA